MSDLNNPDALARLKQACVFIPGPESIGSGYIIAPAIIATALHVVKSWVRGEYYEVLIGIDGPSCRATLLKSDAKSDAALLELVDAPAIEPLPIAVGLRGELEWIAYGFPALAIKIARPPGLVIGGTVADPDTLNDIGQKAILLRCAAIAAGTASPLSGISGAAVVVEGAVIGHLTKHIGDKDDKSRAAYGVVFACPIKAVLDLLDFKPKTVQLSQDQASANISVAIIKQVKAFAYAQHVHIENLVFNAAPTTQMPASTVVPNHCCPYPGLPSFGPQESEFFFGREETVEDLVTAVSRQTLVALVGASGSGKSSVVLAGLAPRLHRNGWIISYFRQALETDNDPFMALARALVPMYVQSSDDTERLRNTRKLATQLRDRELKLSDVLSDCRSRAAGKPILLIADQFEELFTPSNDEMTRCRFIEVLLDGFPEQNANPTTISLILTLRADFFGTALNYRPLADALQDHVRNLGPMNSTELRMAIIRPAAILGVTVDPTLVDALLTDAGGKPGNLPLLQFALRELWGKRKGNLIARSAYDSFGGIAGALVERAEITYSSTAFGGNSELRQRQMHKLFLRLVGFGDGQEETRRVVERTELGEDLWQLARSLAIEDNRLLVTNARIQLGSEAIHHVETVEFAHEALIRNWPRLVGWIDTDRVFQTWLRLISGNVKLFIKDQADEGSMLRGGMLAQAIEWYTGRSDDFSADEKRLIEASIAHRDRDVAEKATLERLKARRARLAVYATLISFVFGAFGWVQARRAEQNLLRYEQMSDVVLVKELLQQAHELVPARPEVIPRMEAWLSKARRLGNGKAMHRQSRDELRLRAQPSHINEGPNISPQDRRSYRSTEYLFDSDHDSWRHDVLTDLLNRLSELESTMKVIEARIEFASSVRAVSIDAFQTEWAQCASDIETDTRFAGLRLKPQLGLVPLTKNGASGLWEFWHVASGDRPNVEGNLLDGQVIFGEDSGIILVLVPGGVFRMGAQSIDPSGSNYFGSAAANESPVTDVDLDPFFISKYELTVAQWARITTRELIRDVSGKAQEGKSISGLDPVAGIDWSTASAVMREQDLSLPTEAQWEFAARGMTDSPWWTGKEITTLQGAGNIADAFAKQRIPWPVEEVINDGFAGSSPVGLFRPNPFGLYDVIGNVWEWCQDRYGSYAIPPRRGDGLRDDASSTLRVDRGGGFSDTAVNVRSAVRYGAAPGSQDPYLGIRPARPVDF